jgi:AcrR family transcriptional regulator
MPNRKNFPEKQVVSQIKNPNLVEEKQELIVKAASELFCRKGYHSTTLREISAESHINLSYLYKYISSKDDILYLFYRHLHKKWAPLYEQLADEIDANPVDQLRDFLRSIFDIINKFQDEVLTMYTESRHLQKESLHTVLGEESRMIDCLEKLIIRGKERGYFKTEDSFFAANIIQFIVTFHTLRGWNFMDHYTFTRFVELVQGFIFSALGVKEEKAG